MDNNNKRQNSRKIGFGAGIFGFFGIILGAFGAHALKERLTAQNLEVWNTAVTFQLFHAVALLALAAWSEARAQAGAVERARGQKYLWRAAQCWMAGIAFFSGSLYLLALGGPTWLGPVTPLGGLLLIAGWALVALAARN
jgi:uncharacterized membrane protein YgdD (TMEM256/DUF423 family)